LIEKLSGRRTGIHKSISLLAKFGLIARVPEARYDGYRLTYGGLDYLALHAHSQRRAVYSVGNQIGVGKESDIIVVADEAGAQRVLKIHRLGRISFRTVKQNRDYLKRRQAGSWMYLSRLSAMREYAFMQALRAAGFPVPEPIAHSRHTIVMSLVDAFPLRQIASVPDPASLYAELVEMILRLACHGLIHGDFNEFNILIREDEEKAEEDGDGPVIKLTPILIDFPQMVSMDHQNAEMYFDRDVACIKRFFERKFQYISTTPGPFFKDAKASVGRGGANRIDAEVEASGFTKKMAKELEAAIKVQQASKDKELSGSEKDEDEEDEEDEDNEIMSASEAEQDADAKSQDLDEEVIPT
jgi:RIO kinase 2